MPPSDKEQEAPNTIQFKHFDIIESGESALSDHYYTSEKNHGRFGDPTSNISKQIFKEWRILERNLPESIYVRAYEQRIDLLRAVIVGAPRTPYHDGLFFFDIRFPKNYPSLPPKVYYHSHGYRLNPNLYPNGKVCLSLINTWDGRGVEKWIPTNSTILQVLVSIQGLVLNDKPYFNEPGYSYAKHDPSKHWVKKSLSYNKDAFIMSCKTMLHKLHSPPKGFEHLVVEHCRQQGSHLLAAIKEYYIGGSVIGQYSQDGASSSSAKVKISSRYKSILQKMHMDLITAFSQHRILPSEILQQAKLEDIKATKGKGAKKEKVETDEAKKKPNKKGIVSRIVHKLKKILGWRFAE